MENIILKLIKHYIILKKVLYSKNIAKKKINGI